MLFAPGSPTGIATALAFEFASLGLLFRRARRWFVGLGAVLLASTLAYRAIGIIGNPRVSVITLPARSLPWGDLLFDEQDLVLPASILYAWSYPSSNSLPGAVHATYARLRAAEGPTPSPLPGRLFGESASGFDTVVFTPSTQDSKAASDLAVIFLHGYAGSFIFECWLVAEPARRAGATTYCPATGFDGRWWEDDGLAIVERTMEEAAGRGARRFVLAGLSNGGYGASLLAKRLKNRLSGLVLISGVSPDAEPPEVPVLLVHGTRDPNLPIADAEAFAQKRGVEAMLVELDGGHYISAERWDELGNALESWLRARAR